METRKFLIGTLLFLFLSRLPTEIFPYALTKHNSFYTLFDIVRSMFYVGHFYLLILLARNLTQEILGKPFKLGELKSYMADQADGPPGINQSKQDPLLLDRKFILRTIILNTVGLGLLLCIALLIQISRDDRSNIGEVLPTYHDYSIIISPEPILQQTVNNHFNTYSFKFADEESAGRATESYEKMSVKDLTRLCRTAILNREYDKEFSIILKWATIPRSPLEYHRYLEYLREDYLTHFRYLKSTEQAHRLKWLSNQLIKRLLVYDVDPLTSTEFETRKLYNNLFVTAILYSDGPTNYSNIDDLIHLENVLKKRFKETVRIDHNRNKFLSDVSTYFNAMYFFRLEESDKAMVLMESITTSENYMVANLARLQLARFYFWAIDRNRESTKNQGFITKMKRLEEKVEVKNFKTDINYYLIRVETNE